MQSRRIYGTVTWLRLRSATLAIVALVALALGHVSAWAHDGTVRHVRCAQHGELVDAPELVRAIAGGSWLVGVQGETSDEHCALANGIRHAVSQAAAPASQVAPIAIPIAVPIATPQLAAAIDYRIAPKTSPPGC